MAKRTRGAHRPTRRRPGNRPGPRASATAAPAPAARPSGSLTPEEEARAAEIEARIVAEERAATQPTRRVRDRVRSDAPVARGRDMAPLSVRAGEEYAYVRRDVIRIVRVGGALLGLLAVLYALVHVFRVIAI